MRSSRPSLAGATLIASALLALLALLPGVPVPVRALVIVGFALIAPGVAWVRLLAIEDRLAEWTLGIACSVAIGTLVASVQAYAGAWSPTGTIAVLAVIVVAAVATELAGTPDRQRQEAQ
jgi:hypothetical protein